MTAFPISKMDSQVVAKDSLLLLSCIPFPPDLARNISEIKFRMDSGESNEVLSVFPFLDLIRNSSRRYSKAEYLAQLEIANIQVDELEPSSLE